ncbi:MAG: hypothetical protein II772_05540 [Lachnospiraceae bacterium]|nr:hypothetical protein [Lachnospiraceae bacterium]
MKRYLKILPFFVPFIVGLIGFLFAGEEVLNAAFNSFLLYFLGYSDPAVNPAIEVARWIAPVATAGGAITVAVQFATSWKNAVRNGRRDSLAVYGDGPDAEFVKAQVGARLITPIGNGFVRARRYVLMMDEQENLEFYAANRERLKDCPVCLRCTSIASHELAGDRLKVCNLEEMAARIFWKQSDVYETARACGCRMKIVIIGFGKLGQELLLKGLQHNIFSADQRIEYHVFGDSGDFRKLYHCLDRVGDPVVFHDDWKDDMDLIRGADMTILANLNDELSLARDLLFAVNEKKLYVLTDMADVIGLLDGRGRLEIFDWKKEVLSEECLFEDKLLESAKRINLRYAHLYSGTAETPENADAEWRKLDSFTKCSNVSSADYHEVREKMLAKWGLPSDGTGISGEQMETLSELEHIRWSRYHYLSNWTYGVPEGGRAKDAEKRIHADLKPYAELTEGEKQKDRDTIGIMLKLNSVSSGPQTLL